MSDVIRRYRAAGECRELGIASVPHGGIIVEQLADGTYQMAPNQEADLFEATAADAADSTDEPTATTEPPVAAPELAPEPVEAAESPDATLATDAPPDAPQEAVEVPSPETPPDATPSEPTETPATEAEPPTETPQA